MKTPSRFWGDPRAKHWSGRLISDPRVPIIASLGRITGNRRASYYGVQWLLVSTILARWSHLEPAPILRSSTRADSPHSSNAGFSRGQELRQLLDSYGSDKGSHHGYADLYEELVHDPQQLKLLVEIGIGSNDPHIPSNMGVSGNPGASLRAFRDWGVSKVFGADIDKAVLIQEPGIETFYLDQLQPSSFAQMREKIAIIRGFDLCIIDGLHSPYSDLITLIELLPLMAYGGVCVVEDIEKDSQITSIWQFILERSPEWVSTRSTEFDHGNLLIFTHAQGLV